MDLNVAVALAAVAAAVPDREAIVAGDRRLTWAEVDERTTRLAGALLAAGVGDDVDARPGAGPPWASPHDHVGLLLHNGPAYLESMVGAWKARAVAFNLNYRFTPDELVEVLADASAVAVVAGGALVATLAEALPRLPLVRLVLQVDDGSGAPLLPGAVDYEAAVAAATPDRPPVDPSPDDRYLLYTGGTTGRPKGVLWRQADFVVGCLGVDPAATPASLADAAPHRGRLRVLPSAPFMHGAAHWNAFSAWLAGGTVVVQDRPDRFDPADVLATAARERVTSLLVVGDAVGRPLLEEAGRGGHDLSHLRHLLTGGAVLSPSVKRAWAELVPGLGVVDLLGSSEAGRQGVSRTRGGDHPVGGRFSPAGGAAVLSADRTRLLAPGDPELGWLATSGRVPLGYLGDPERTAATFPVVDGVRWAVPGDRARFDADGTVVLAGRDAATVNTGGEKVFAEEVEVAVRSHPAVADAVVVGRPSERWGQEVVAVVEPRPGHAPPSVEDLRAWCDGRLARYKLPRAVVAVDRVTRQPSGKPDYAWARRAAAGGAAPT
ncbi:MAG TPA: AMP-binding protein [Acidimicrobiales bacterium]